MPSDKIDLDAIRARVEATSSDQWELRTTSTLYMNGQAGFTVRMDGEPGIKATITAQPGDAELMVAARADVPALLAEVDRLRDLVEQVTREKFREKTELRAFHAEVLERLHADYNEQINALGAKLARYRRAVAAVRSVHHPSRPEFTDNYNYEGDYDTCPACTTDPHLVRWPCDTVRAIEEAITP